MIDFTSPFSPSLPRKLTAAIPFNIILTTLPPSLPPFRRFSHSCAGAYLKQRLTQVLLPTLPPSLPSLSTFIQLRYRRGRPRHNHRGKITRKRFTNRELPQARVRRKIVVAVSFSHWRGEGVRVVFGGGVY